MTDHSELVEAATEAMLDALQAAFRARDPSLKGKDWREERDNDPKGWQENLPALQAGVKAVFPIVLAHAGEGETLQSIIQWGDETFGPCSPERAVSRGWEEWQEMLREEPGSGEFAVEAADVIICLLRIPGILDAINAKMVKNRKRKWRLMGDGSGYHIPAAEIEGGR
jgi:hypothetical protein